MTIKATESEMSRGENGHQEPEPPLDFIDEMEIHPIEMSRGENADYQEVIQCLTSKIHKGAQKAESLSSAHIYSVAEELRKLNESAYTPRLIAIGPLHRNDKHLETPMQHIKMSYANKLLCRMTQGMEDQELAEQKKITVLQECVAAMEMSIEDAKKCYTGEVTVDVEMMLVDGCFILEFLYRSNLHRYRFYLQRNGYNQEVETSDPLFRNALTTIAVQHDLLLLENQIPFFVLEKLFTLTLARIPNNPLENLSLTNYVFLSFVARFMSTTNSTNSGSAKTSCWPRDCVLWVSVSKMNNSVAEDEVSSRNANYYHILHKLHDDFRPRGLSVRNTYLELIPSASELAYAGVKFVTGTGNDLFKIKFTEPEGPFWWFRSAHFEIPSFELSSQTEPFLSNFVAFEHRYKDISEHFSSYVVLMEMLVNSDIDVQVLTKAGILDSWLGASEVNHLFNKLCKEIVIRDFYFADQCKRANRFSKRFWPKNMAYLRRQYFASPWKFIAFCLGFVYFGITIAQLIVSIKKNKPPMIMNSLLYHLDH